MAVAVAVATAETVPVDVPEAVPVVAAVDVADMVDTAVDEAVADAVTLTVKRAVALDFVDAVCVAEASAVFDAEVDAVVDIDTLAVRVSVADGDTDLLPSAEGDIDGDRDPLVLPVTDELPRALRDDDKEGSAEGLYRRDVLARPEILLVPVNVRDCLSDALVRADAEALELGEDDFEVDADADTRGDVETADDGLSLDDADDVSEAMEAVASREESALALDERLA